MIFLNSIKKKSNSRRISNISSWWNDERVEIYSEYSDEIYDKFISEGLKIHQKYNNNNACNPNNTKLLLHDEKCETFTESGLENVHGG
jgi:hypothetical protein